MEIMHGYSKGVIGRDMYSDNTLRHMTKSELIELLMIAQHNYESVLEFYGRAVEHSEKLLKERDDIDKFCRDLCKIRMSKGKPIPDFEDLQDYIRKQKSEAIREFVERLKKKTYPFPCAIGVENAVTVRGIYDLLEEMVGEDDG